MNLPIEMLDVPGKFSLFEAFVLLYILRDATLTGRLGQFTFRDEERSWVSSPLPGGLFQLGGKIGGRGMVRGL